MATVDIELYYDLDRRRWTTSAGGLASQPSLFIGQSNTIDFKVRFVQNGVPIELTAPSWIAGRVAMLFTVSRTSKAVELVEGVMPTKYACNSTLSMLREKV